jgi:phosphohistidine phosphatase
MAHWLDRQLPEGTRILVSPARRTEQTAKALDRKYKIRPELAPSATVEQLLQLAQWPNAKQTVLLVGHQPVLGQAIAQLLGLTASECAVRRGAVWWLRHREREGVASTVVVTVQSPEVL